MNNASSYSLHSWRAYLKEVLSAYAFTSYVTYVEIIMLFDLEAKQNWCVNSDYVNKHINKVIQKTTKQLPDQAIQGRCYQGSVSQLTGDTQGTKGSEFPWGTQQLLLYVASNNLPTLLQFCISVADIDPALGQRLSV